MTMDEPEAFESDLWRRREPRPAAPYFKRAEDAKDHAFDRERGDPIPPSWLKTHGRSLVRYHLHPESKFEGGGYDQRGVLRRRHVRALMMQAISKESDNLEENEFVGKDAGPVEHPMEGSSVKNIAAFVFEMQKRHEISDRKLLDRAKVSPHTLKTLREGKSIGDASLTMLFRAAEALRLEADPIAAAMDNALEELRRLRDEFGGRNKLAKLLGVSGPYLGRVLRGEKPMTVELTTKVNGTHVS